MYKNKRYFINKIKTWLKFESLKYELNQEFQTASQEALKDTFMKLEGTNLNTIHDKEAYCFHVLKYSKK
ncbi:MAG: hypothetical protein AAGF26_14105, partial [Cyanobacteria bacterium P01_G01_bin.49]